MKKKKKTNKNLQPNQVVCAEMTGLDTSSVGKVPSWHPTFADDDSSSNSSISIPFKNNTRKKKKNTRWEVYCSHVTTLKEQGGLSAKTNGGGKDTGVAVYVTMP